MIFAALKTLTWGTVATAVVSALLLAWAGGNFPRIAAITGDVMRGRISAPAKPNLAATRSNEAAPAAAAARDGASH